MPGRHQLSLHRGGSNDPAWQAARLHLLRETLGPESCPTIGADGPWTAFCLLASDGTCVANVDAARLPLVANGVTLGVTAIRSVAVDQEWRGRGLFRTLMTEALAWCDAQSAGSTLLYAEEPDLYRRFDFRPVAQHAFVGVAPTPRRGAKGRSLDPHDGKDARLIEAAIARRAPPSSRCALMIDAPQFLANVAKDADIAVTFDAAHDAVIVSQDEADVVTIVDVVAPAMPDLPTILGALDLSPTRARTLFPPDRLGWEGIPVREDTGLMLRGPMPEAMARPFMLPPTAEF